MAQALQRREGGELDHGRGPAKENERVGRCGGQVRAAHLAVDEALAVLPALSRLVKSEPKMEILVLLRQLLRFVRVRMSEIASCKSRVKTHGTSDCKT